jgi:AraC family transcriptional regulator
MPDPQINISIQDEGHAEPAELAAEGAVLELFASLDCERNEHAHARPRWLVRVIDRLRTEFHEPFSLAGLAAEAGVHPGHLWRVFRDAEGCAPSVFVQRLRCRHVFRRLSEGGGTGSLADIALEAGFSDQSHCTRVFRRLVGVSPGELRHTLAP